MRFRIAKFVANSANLALLWFTWKLFWGELDFRLALGSLLLGGFWLIFTSLRLRQLLTSYADPFSRMQVLVPFWTGMVLAGLAVISTDDFATRCVAGGEAVAWLAVYGMYRRNRSWYIKQGSGPLPANAWVCPDWRALKEGDLILFGGAMAGRLHATVGHGELVLRTAKRMITFSSFMERGAVNNSLRAVTRASARSAHYIVLRLRQGFSPEENERALKIMEEMLAANCKWRDATNARRARCISWLPLPRKWKLALTQKFRASGYDWAGLLIGTRANNRWTCIAACLELLHRLGIKTNQYGTGLLGLGTGLLNPIMPVRFLFDPAFELLTLEHKRVFEATNQPETGEE